MKKLYIEVRSWFDFGKVIDHSKGWRRQYCNIYTLEECLNNPLTVTGQNNTSCSLLFKETGKIVGIHLFEYSSEKKVLVSRGIVLSPKYRNKGLGRQLWSISLNITKPREVIVDTVSLGGMKLVNGLKKEFRGIKWTHWNHYLARKTNAIIDLQ